MGRLKSFLAGFASAFDLTGGSSDHSYHYSGFERDQEAFDRDREALAGDWRQVGDDMRWAMNQIDMEIANGRTE